MGPVAPTRRHLSEALAAALPFEATLARTGTMSDGMGGRVRTAAGEPVAVRAHIAPLTGVQVDLPREVASKAGSGTPVYRLSLPLDVELSPGDVVSIEGRAYRVLVAPVRAYLARTYAVEVR